MAAGRVLPYHRARFDGEWGQTSQRRHVRVHPSARESVGRPPGGMNGRECVRAPRSNRVVDRRDPHGTRGVRVRRRGRALGLDTSAHAHPGAFTLGPHGRRGHERLLLARPGRHQRRVRQDRHEAARRRALGDGPARRAEPPDLRQEPRVGSEHRPVPRARQGSLPAWARRESRERGLLRRPRPRRRRLRADPGQERERLLRELRRPGRLRPLHAARRQLLRDLHAGELPGRTREPAGPGQRLRLSVSAARGSNDLQDPHVRTGRLHARLDRARRRSVRTAHRSASPTAIPARSGTSTVPSEARARAGGSAMPATRDVRGRPGRRTASSAPAPRAAAPITPPTSTRCSSTRPGPTRSAPTAAPAVRSTSGDEVRSIRTRPGCTRRRTCAEPSSRTAGSTRPAKR